MRGNPTPPLAKPSLTCDALQKTEVSRDTFKFSTKATAKDGASVTSYILNFLSMIYAASWGLMGQVKLLGKSTVKVLPLPTMLLTLMTPPRYLTMLAAMESPSPVP